MGTLLRGGADLVPEAQSSGYSWGKGERALEGADLLFRGLCALRIPEPGAGCSSESREGLANRKWALATGGKGFTQAGQSPPESLHLGVFLFASPAGLSSGSGNWPGS